MNSIKHLKTTRLFLLVLVNVCLHNIFNSQTTLNLIIMLHILITINNNTLYNLINKMYTKQTIMSTFNNIYYITNC